MPGTPRHRAARLWRGGGLAMRIAAMSLLLLLVVQLAGFAVVRSSIDANARESLNHELTVGARLWEQLIDQRAQKLTQGAALLAADYGFLSSLNDRDVDTVRSALDNAGERIGAGLTALLDRELQPRAVGEHADPKAMAAVLRLSRQLITTRSMLTIVDQRPYQLVMVPVRAAGMSGWVVMGFALDQALLDKMRELSGLQVALLTRAPGQAATLAMSTLPEALARQATWPSSGSGEARIGSDEYLAHAVLHAPELQALLLRSVTEAVAPYRQLQALLAGITALGLALFAVGSLAAARRVTEPLRRLAGASERLGQGDYSEALPDTGRRDEIGELARAFDQMRSNISAGQAEIRALAYTDRLTGMPNQASFRAAVQAAIEQVEGRAGQSLSVLMLDLDRFKHVNDMLGYASGDTLLNAVAQRLTEETVRDGDMVARLGGDEFALLLRGADADQALAVARRIARSFERPLALGDQMVDLSAGIGIACWPTHARDADALLSRAEVAMYGAKRRSDGALVYDPAVDAASAQTLSLLSDLRHAVEHDELRLYLQPQVSLGDNHLSGAEALLRWQHPRNGMIPPLQFIPFAEQTGFVRQLTLWVAEASAKAWAPLHALGLQRLSINLSMRDLMDAELPATLEAILTRHGVPTRAFCLEITESAIMDDPGRARATLDSLAQRGFQLAIDDFGTGYSSLAYLRQLPVNELKIDKSFVMGMDHNEGDVTIVRSTIDLAHNLGLTVVAEGVENGGVLARLRELGCDEMQGYLVSRPQPVAEFSAWAARCVKRRDGRLSIDPALRLH
jgi:diguanylate cyclase (GGDEF)-like protein